MNIKPVTTRNQNTFSKGSSFTSHVTRIKNMSTAAVNKITVMRVSTANARAARRLEKDTPVNEMNTSRFQKSDNFTLF